ncbi:TetR/AcrR family transcriptional regulator [Herbinix luporum]|uniref:TetR/AcrR family transcriptional regulator n=1 Tax=Herbinix luporum TaxID=1679721 RepID=UPI0023F3CFD1|nr:TetR/AcrR family transcriptional regulator [Herbinix luporum]
MNFKKAEKTNTNQKNKRLKSEYTIKRIKEKYLLLIKEKKWDKITVKEICAEANITRGTFYQYFNDIYDLMEQIETPLLQEIANEYKTISKMSIQHYPLVLFEEKFDYTPPKTLLIWFDFCKKHRNKIAVLLGPNGDSYFISKLKNILKGQINLMMDGDGMPNDELRKHFSKIFLELHFLAARTWLESSEDNFLPVESIINLLNTMRVGANYLSYRRLVSPDFDIKMKIPEEG